MQLFGASCAFAVAVGLGLAPATLAAFSSDPSFAGEIDRRPRFDFGATIAGVRPGESFDSSFAITHASGEETGIVRLAGTFSPEGIVTFQMSVANNTGVPLLFTLFESSSPIDVIDPVGRAFSVASVTDRNGDGATLSGGHESGAMVEFGYIPGPDASVAPIFDSQLFNPIVAAPLSTASAGDESSPAPGFLPIAGRAIALNASVRVLLSAGDMAQVQGAFMVLVPSPGAGALAALTGLTLMRRRRTN